MNPEIIYCEQMSDDWFQARLGIVTASRFSEVLGNPTKSGRKTYMMKLLAEKIRGIPEYSYHNKYMDDGIEIEPHAREYYEAAKKVKVEQVGFVKLGDIGYSPDGLIEDDGTLEIKCPLGSTHISYILSGKLPSVYVPQVQGGLMVTGRQWCDFVSFDPDNPIRPFWCIRVGRDEKKIAEIQKACDIFVYELKELVDKITVPF